jgi:hypothetical protein
VSIYQAARIVKPPHFAIAPLRSGRGKRTPYVIGFDSEAEHGKPFMYQFAHPDDRVDLLHLPTDKYAGIREFFRYLRDNCTRKDCEYIVVGFNLMYEWTQLFACLDDEMKTADEMIVKLWIDTRDNAVQIRALNEKRFTLTAEFGRLSNDDEFISSTKRRVKMIDAMAYFTMSLDEAGKVIGAGDKLDKPKHFARRYAHSPDFLAYARQDAVITQKLGEYIISLHQRYDVTTSVSAPHFAARAFRKHYLKRELELPPIDLEQLGLWSYHGGKNGFYLDRPKTFKDIWHYDIRSAYPEAMSALPNIETAIWEQVNEYEPGVAAIWSIKAYHRRCTYRAFMHPDGKWCESGFIETVVTSYELDTAIELGEIKLPIKCTGYVMRGPSGGPLVDYCRDFYSMKQAAKTEGESLAAKLFLNSLYGKFFQKVPVGRVGTYDLRTGEYTATAPEQEYDYEAGGLYHPPIASLITGFVRAKIHRLEHKYQSVMTSTDGFFGFVQPDPADLGKKLGELKAEKGSLRIWRERVYVFIAHNVEHTKHCKPDCDRKHELYAKHGFRGTLQQLQDMPLRLGYVYEYDAQQMITLKMSVLTFTLPNGKRKRFRAGEFVNLKYHVKLSRGQSP